MDQDEIDGDPLGVVNLPAWGRAVAIIGIPGAIAFFLVWAGASEIPKIVSGVEANRQALQVIMARELEAERRDLENFRMLQRICTNTAKSDDERSRCFDK